MKYIVYAVINGDTQFYGFAGNLGYAQELVEDIYEKYSWLGKVDYIIKPNLQRRNK